MQNSPSTTLTVIESMNTNCPHPCDLVRHQNPTFPLHNFGDLTLLSLDRSHSSDSIHCDFCLSLVFDGLTLLLFIVVIVIVTINQSHFIGLDLTELPLLACGTHSTKWFSFVAIHVSLYVNF